MRWHYTITNEMREAGLSGNSLLVYAVLHGYSQNGQGCFFGSLNYLSDIVGVSPRSLREILGKLVSGGFITEKPRPGDTTVYMCSCCTKVSRTSGRKKLPGRAEETSGVIDNNSYNALSMSLDISKAKNDTDICVDPPRFFHAPTVEEVAAYCASRGNTVDATAFVAHYQANGWKVGKAPMKDWKAAVRYWETQERQRSTGTPTPKAPSRQQSAYDKMAAMLEENHERLAAEEGGQL